MKTGLLAVAALIGSTEASGNDKKRAYTFEFSDGVKLKGYLYWFRHPATGHPYLTVEADLSEMDIGDGLTLCYDFAPSSLDKVEFTAGKKDNFPINVYVDKDTLMSGPKAFLKSVSKGKNKHFADCNSGKVGKFKSSDWDNLSHVSTTKFDAEAKSGKVQVIRPICLSKDKCEASALKMVPGEEWHFDWGFGGKKTIYSPADDRRVVTVKIPELTEIDTMGGDFVTFKGASHLTSSIILATAALASMTLY